MVRELTIRMQPRGEHFTVGSLIRAMERTLDALRSYAKRNSQQPPNSWTVQSLSANGELWLTVQGDIGSPAYLSGMRTLEANPVAPPEFDETDMENARRLVGLLENDVDSIVLSAPGEEPVTATQHIAANVD